MTRHRQSNHWADIGPANNKIPLRSCNFEGGNIKKGSSDLNIYDHTGTRRRRPHQEAHRLAQIGILVGPLNGKKPVRAAVPRGLYDFTTDREAIDTWWVRYNGANLGARPPKGIVVIDVDNRRNGLGNWDALNAGHELPKTTTTRTGSGGYHFWLRLPYPGQLRGKVAPDIDIRHHRNYLVMPGSVHPETGGEYEYEAWVDLPDVPVLPAHLRRHVYAPARPASPAIPYRLRHSGDGKKLIKAVLEAPEGSRNEQLNTVAFLAGKNGLDIFDALAKAAEAVGLEPEEIDATIRSGKRAGEKEALQ